MARRPAPHERRTTTDLLDVSVMVVDDHPMWRATLRDLIESGGVGRVVAEAGDGELALQLADETSPDLIVMDINLPGINGTETTRILVGQRAGVRVLVLSASDDPGDVLAAVRAGASGYLLKTSEPADVLDAITRVHRGGLVLPPRVADVVLAELRQPSPQPPPVPGPSPRVLVADRSALVREGLRRILSEAGIHVVGSAATMSELLARVQTSDLDAVIVQGDLPGTADGGDDPALVIRTARPDVAVLILADDVEAVSASTVLEGPTDRIGYLLKDALDDIEQIADTLRRIVAGEVVIDPAVGDHLLRAQRRRAPINGLSPREREVLALMAEGRSNRAISERLFISQKAVEAHVHSIFVKLSLGSAPDDHRRVLAVLAYLGDR